METTFGEAGRSMSARLPFVYDDGGREAAGYRGRAGDCVCRAIAIVTGRPYAEIYAALADGSGRERKSRGRSARNGIRVRRKWFKEYMRSLGFVWTPTMGIGTGCRVHLAAGELPAGRLVVAVSKHYTAVVDGVIRDTGDPGERGATVYPPGYPFQIPRGAERRADGCYVYRPMRCVYGYWTYKGAS